MPLSAAVDGFRLAYDRAGSGPPVVLLHGWPGDRQDHREVVPLLTGAADVVVPDLRGFGESDKHPADPKEAYGAPAQVRSVLGLMDELGLEDVVLSGYDVGSRVAQAVARAAPGRVRALVVTPPLPGAGHRVLRPESQPEFWYQSFHRIALSEVLLDGNADGVLAYLRHFWNHWSAPGWEPDEDALRRLAAHYAPPGAFTASIGWYRAGSGMVATSLSETVPEAADRIAVPTTVLWPEHDPIFPREWADRLGEFFAEVTVLDLPGSGHFAPLETPDGVARAILAALA
ncbi:alpha/beta hydrolase [Baekduia soli]|uniref:Alpha/beta hydrolase n=1 Tax=Baekduia soli TaxID=496014 RepID=A0A5B8U9K2_9ACTN|nr:alpha/beta hydrolase [Baekduia soli]QEC49322.1 alpha/beta hydrolase [Baekduia soli]